MKPRSNVVPWMCAVLDIVWKIYLFSSSLNNSFGKKCDGEMKIFTLRTIRSFAVVCFLWTRTGRRSEVKFQNLKHHHAARIILRDCVTTNNLNYSVLQDNNHRPTFLIRFNSMETSGCISLRAIQEV